MTPARVPLVVLALLALAAPTAAQGAAEPGQTDVVLTLAGTAEPALQAPDGMATLAEVEPGERVVLDLVLEAEYVVVEVRVAGWFDVERPRQALPLLDDQFFVPIRFDPSEVDSPARVANVNGTGGEFVYRLGVPGPGDRRLVLERDVAPPAFRLGAPTSRTHQSFIMTTTTEEHAFADLQIRKAGADAEWIRNPTTIPALEQTFPVQGLQAETDYDVRVRFWDWSENEVWSETARVTTEPEPARPKPVVTALSPLPDERLATTVSLILARVESPESPVTRDGVRLFVDKREVHDGFTLEDGALTYRVPMPLGAGLHSVSVEALNAAGGLGVARWSFTILGGAEVAGESSVPAAGVLAALAALGVVGAARGRHPGKR